MKQKKFLQILWHPKSPHSILQRADIMIHKLLSMLDQYIVNRGNIKLMIDSEVFFDHFMSSRDCQRRCDFEIFRRTGNV